VTTSSSSIAGLFHTIFLKRNILKIFSTNATIPQIGLSVIVINPFYAKTGIVGLKHPKQTSMIRNSTLICTVILLLGSLTSFARTNGNTKFKYEKIKDFIPEGFYVYDTASGDFNADGYTDYVIVLGSNVEGAESANNRPLLVLQGAPKGKFELLARNDNVVLCATCGGVFGDPYSKVSLDGQLLKVEHNVGGNWQWSRVITFKYNTEKKEFVLDEDITKSFQKFNPNNQKTIASNKKDFGTLPFAEYAYNKGFRE
jgi:hypothetical protein